MGDLLRREIERRGGSADGSAQLPELSDEESSAEAIQLIPRLARSATPLILGKSWILYTTISSNPFCIGDNPVTLDNSTNDTEVVGNLGLASQGIEIYLPISDTVSMGFLCPSNEALVRDTLPRAESLAATRHIDAVRSIVRALDGDAPLLFNEQNVMRHNSLQISYAERYVFSRDDSFSLVRQMITSNPESRTGPRFTVS